MPKYTEAFFNITHKPVTIMQIRNFIMAECFAKLLATKPLIKELM